VYLIIIITNKNYLYFRINGTPACANKKLLTDITRKEWGFKGFVVSDGNAIKYMVTAHKYAKNKKAAATKAIKAGCNLELTFQPNALYPSQKTALKDGSLTEQEIRNNSKPLFYSRMRLGEFDPVKLNPYNRINASVVQSNRHRKLALEAAVKSFVLLKNDQGALPLREKVKNLAVSISILLFDAKI
jgi:beta-glucosidase